MAISLGVAKILMEDGLSKAYSGSCIQLGVQGIMFTSKKLIEAASFHGYKLSEPVNVPTPLAPNAFFKQLGFQTITSIDANSYEGCDIVHDLNKEIEREDLLGKFDLVFDGGTMEHVFNVPCVLKNASLLAKTGGRIVHVVPCSNMINHGFYSFSPTLFFDYYRTNNFTIRKVLLLRYSSEQICYLDITKFNSIVVPELFLDGYTYLLYCSVEKTSESTTGITPQQTMYLDTWQRADSTSTRYSHFANFFSNGRSNSIKSILRRTGTFLIARKVFHYLKTYKQRRKFNWVNI